MALGFSQEGKARPARKADNRIAIFEPTILTMWDISQPYRPAQPVTGIASLLLYCYCDSCLQARVKLVKFVVFMALTN
jgi:hypothetical protein